MKKRQSREKVVPIQETDLVWVDGGDETETLFAKIIFPLGVMSSGSAPNDFSPPKP